jgi:phosphopantetheinyl transferase
MNELYTIKFNVDDYSYYFHELKKNLSIQELKTLSNKKRKNSKIQFILSRILIKKIAFPDVKMNDINVKFCSQNQALIVEYKQKKSKHLYFLSHSKECICIFANEKGRIGIDVEFEDPKRTVLQNTSTLFHENEKNVELKSSFYTLWTLKESYAKYTISNYLDILKVDIINQLKLDDLSHFSLTIYNDYKLSVIYNPNNNGNIKNIAKNTIESRVLNIEGLQLNYQEIKV